MMSSCIVSEAEKLWAKPTSATSFSVPQLCPLATVLWFCLFVPLPSFIVQPLARRTVTHKNQFYAILLMLWLLERKAMDWTVFHLPQVTIYSCNIYSILGVLNTVSITCKPSFCCYVLFINNSCTAMASD